MCARTYLSMPLSLLLIFLCAVSSTVTFSSFEDDFSHQRMMEPMISRNSQTKVSSALCNDGAPRLCQLFQPLCSVPSRCDDCNPTAPLQQRRQNGSHELCSRRQLAKNNLKDAHLLCLRSSEQRNLLRTVALCIWTAIPDEEESLNFQTNYFVAEAEMEHIVEVCLHGVLKTRVTHKPTGFDDWTFLSQIRHDAPFSLEKEESDCDVNIECQTFWYIESVLYRMCPYSCGQCQ